MSPLESVSNTVSWGMCLGGFVKHKKGAELISV